jgi:hypothetical protein
MSRALLISALISLAIWHVAPAREPEAAQTIEELEGGIQNKSPATYFALATELYRKGEKEAASFWYYVGEVRYRFLLLARAKSSEASDEQAHFWFLSESVGRSIYEKADQRSAVLMRTIDRALAWDLEQPNGYTSKAAFRAEYERARQELLGLRQRINEDAAGFTAGRKGIRDILSW